MLLSTKSKAKSGRQGQNGAGKEKIIDSLAEDLRRRRLAIVGGVGEIEGDLRTITQEREPEMEEDAQKVRIATVLERLSDREQRALDEIDEALKRIVSGTYGRCASCDSPIALGRLRAIPTARLCIDCARARENRPAGAAEEEPGESRMSADLSFLDREQES
jgi:DnaK suppressor protein